VTGALRIFAPLGLRVGGLGSGDVAVYQGTFLPKTLAVEVGRRVVWSVQATTHTVTSDDGLFDSGILAAGEEFSYTFTQSGVYPYYCRLHGQPGGIGHSGTIVVS
jgi:plastocyanin